MILSEIIRVRGVLGLGFGPGFFLCLAGGGGGGGGGGGASAVEEEEDVDVDSRGEGESDGRGELAEESEDPAITPVTKPARWRRYGGKREQRKPGSLFPIQFVARGLVCLCGRKLAEDKKRRLASRRWSKPFRQR